MDRARKENECQESNKCQISTTLEKQEIVNPFEKQMSERVSGCITLKAAGSMWSWMRERSG